MRNNAPSLTTYLHPDWRRFVVQIQVYYKSFGAHSLVFNIRLQNKIYKGKSNFGNGRKVENHLTSVL